MPLDKQPELLNKISKGRLGIRSGRGLSESVENRVPVLLESSMWQVLAAGSL